MSNMLTKYINKKSLCAGLAIKTSKKRKITSGLERRVIRYCFKEIPRNF